MASKKSKPNTSRLAPIPYKDFVANNPRANRQYMGGDDDAEKSNSDRTLYDEKKSKKSYTTVKRMLSAYKRRKREEKIDKLTNDGSLWKGLEQYELDEDLNRFISKVRSLYYKGSRKSFRQFMKDIEELADELAEVYNNSEGVI
jgi:hypothetical protein